MKLLLDEMWPPDFAEELRRRGYDVVVVAERSDLRTESDEYVFAAAQAEVRVIVTENVRDFRQIAAAHILQGRNHQGLVFTTNRRFPRGDELALSRVISGLIDLLSEDSEMLNRELWLPDRG